MTEAQNPATTAVTTTTFKPRLPIPAGFVSPEIWHVLVDVTYPNANTSAAVLLAWNYCKARNFDILKRPINIVPMWDAKQKQWRETIWPSIIETEITASRTGQWAGLDLPVFGELEQRTFRSDKGEKYEVTFPKTCQRTVYKMIGGQRCPFSEQVTWLENCAWSNGVPNSTWRRRTHDQLAKVAKAAALRAAFPEECGDQTAEEMEGQAIDPVEIAATDSDRRDIPPTQAAQRWEAPAKSEPPHDPATGEIGPHLMPRQILVDGNGEDWRAWGMRFIAGIDAVESRAEVNRYVELNREIIDVDLREEAPKIHEHLIARINRRLNELTMAESSHEQQLDLGE